MRNMKKNVAVLGVIVFFVVVAGMAVATASGGRVYSSCIHTCNAAKSACNVACSADCKALCNNVTSCSDPCILNCKATTCLPTLDECKLMCQSIKNPPSPTEP